MNVSATLLYLIFNNKNEVMTFLDRSSSMIIRESKIIHSIFIYLFIVINIIIKKYTSKENCNYKKKLYEYIFEEVFSYHVPKNQYKIFTCN